MLSDVDTRLLQNKLLKANEEICNLKVSKHFAYYKTITTCFIYLVFFLFFFFYLKREQDNYKKSQDFEDKLMSTAFYKLVSIIVVYINYYLTDKINSQ